MPFENNVFINCPFDDEYRPLLNTKLFTLIFLGFEPRISQTVSSGTSRISQIQRHIRESKYSIHDLSRSRAMKKGELPRFNMPYELGLDIGCYEYGARRMKQKKILILETERYHYKKVLSDIAGQDIEDHNNDPRTLVVKIRNWFSTLDSINKTVGAGAIWNAYNQFTADLTTELKAEDYTDEDIKNMPINDFIKFSKDWIETFNP